MNKSYYLGIDFGTSGARAIVIDSQDNIAAEVIYPFSNSHLSNLARLWQQSLFHLIAQIPQPIRHTIKGIAINGTSATVLLCDAHGNPIDHPILYNDARGVEMLDKVNAIAPANHLAISATSSLAKLLWWQQQHIYSQAKYFLHQADWLAFLLHGKLGISDYHNALKLGYDVQNLCYPAWLTDSSVQPLLPQVFAPGTPIAEITPAIAREYHISSDCVVCTGTTDSIAAFLASKVTTPGEAVTSLGSTLVLKLLSETHIEDSHYGIYSHRLGDLWLTGGASNTGGAVLRKFFSDGELVTLSEQINPANSSGLEYYPLLKPGERFPLNDPNLAPKLEPRPENPVAFLHGLLESMARIEATGYQLLQQLGATPLKLVYTAGGGAKNLTWQHLRQIHLNVPVKVSSHIEAAYGTALLAKVTILKCC